MALKTAHRPRFAWECNNDAKLLRCGRGQVDTTPRGVRISVVPPVLSEGELCLEELCVLQLCKWSRSRVVGKLKETLEFRCALG